jgi:hypothetical protein
MTMETKPIHYELEILDSRENPVIHHAASTPFMPLAVGNTIDLRTIAGPPKRATVTQVEHIIWDAGEHLTHKLHVVTDLER